MGGDRTERGITRTMTWKRTILLPFTDTHSLKTRRRCWSQIYLFFRNIGKKLSSQTNETLTSRETKNSCGVRFESFQVITKLGGGGDCINKE